MKSFQSTRATVKRNKSIAKYTFWNRQVCAYLTLIYIILLFFNYYTILFIGNVKRFLFHLPVYSWMFPWCNLVIYKLTSICISGQFTGARTRTRALHGCWTRIAILTDFSLNQHCQLLVIHFKTSEFFNISKCIYLAVYTTIPWSLFKCHTITSTGNSASQDSTQTLFSML